MTFEEAFEEVGTLVARFSKNEARYLSPNYQEAEVRKDFIDKFFIALGWDVNHDSQTNPYEQEVKVEPAVLAGGQRRADYAFSLAPNFRSVKFFVEAKKPYGELATRDNYFQTIRYAWNSETPLAVLTDFNHFHILDCRYKPDIGTVLYRNVLKVHYSELADRSAFEKLYWLFSRQAVEDGSLEKRSNDLPKIRGKAVQHGLFPGGYQSIDDSFLAELDIYRFALARAFKNKNPQLNSETLTEIVQRTLDRLVFLRFLEDKGIEHQHLMDKFGEKGTAWEDFVATCKRLNNIYNGVVFRQHAILDSTDLQVDDTVFGGICEGLSHVNSPYDFDAIPIHILGSIYERFLGNVIIATAKRVRIEPKPEVRKAGGVYYTPEYVVRYLVEQTVGRLIEGKPPEQVAQMKFADIACGSGSFLLGIFELLLEHHGQYFNNNPQKAKKGDCIELNGQLYLSFRMKRQILQNNIFGVDIDAQAVEVCQLSLYLRLLKEETTGTTHQYQLEFAHTAQLKKLLPDLSSNIACGNSLIGRDISTSLLFEKEEHQINPMDFKDAFPQIMRKGGFSAIVGNPPYVFARDGGFTKTEKQYFTSCYKHQAYQLNTFTLFSERAYSLLRNEGKFGYIIPNNWLSISTMKRFRDFVLNSTGALRIVNNRYKVFRGANVDTSLVCFNKSTPTDVTLMEALQPSKIDPVSVVSPTKLLLEPIIRIRQSKHPEADAVVLKIARHSDRLNKVARVKSGLKAYETGKGSPLQSDAMKAARIYHSTERVSDNHRKYLEGKDVQRYQTAWSGTFLQYGNNLAAPRDSSLFEGERILIRQIPSKLPFAINGALVDGEEVNDINSMIVKSIGPYSNAYLLGIVNSKLMSFWFDLIFDKFQRGIFPQFKVNELAQFPIFRLDLSKRAEKLKHDTISAKVLSLMEAKGRFALANTDKERYYYEAKCAALDNQIDDLVCELYEIQSSERDIIEGALVAKIAEVDAKS